MPRRSSKRGAGWSRKKKRGQHEVVRSRRAQEAQQEITQCFQQERTQHLLDKQERERERGTQETQQEITPRLQDRERERETRAQEVQQKITQRLRVKRERERERRAQETQQQRAQRLKDNRERARERRAQKAQQEGTHCLLHLLCHSGNPSAAPAQLGATGYIFNIMPRRGRKRGAGCSKRQREVDKSRREQETQQETTQRLRDNRERDYTAQLGAMGAADMADTDLFMECEEEELEPWQLIEDDVVDDTGGGMLMSVNNNLNTGIKSVFSTASIGDQQSYEMGKKPMMTVLPSNNTGSPLMNSGSQSLIVTQNPSGIGSQMSMPPMYQPAAVQVLQDPKTGVTSTVTGQPILITTQGFTVKDLRSVQSPVGIVLNVQGGQGAAPYQTKPLTLVPAATQFVKSAVGVPQLWSPVTSIRPATNAFPGSVTTVIPATVTIRSAVPPITQKSAAQTILTQSHLQPKCLTQPMPSPQQPPSHSHVQTPPQPRPQLHGHSQSNLLHHPHAKQLSNHDHKLVNFLQNTNLIRVKASDSSATELRPKPEEVVKTSILPSVQITTTTTTAAPPMKHKSSLISTTSFKLPESNINNGVPIPKDCPKCNIHFNIMESLRLHMAYCCPQLLNSSTPSKSPQQQAHPAPPKAQPPPLPPPPPPTPPTSTQQPALKLAESSQGKLIMLVDDFYYGRDEGSTFQMVDEMKPTATFRCISCLKRLKNNIRFMNHMKHHVELEQQNDESIENHTTCQHCFRQYATPFQLQCHIENVHSNYETTTKCKICELAFETEQLFLQHMKDTHKPGEMPYVCQVCEYRSSVYLDVDNHFRMIHEDTKNLLCPYCLKVLKNSCTYQQHYMKHQKKSVSPCNKCRLQFTNAKEKMEHKVEHHKTFKKPKQLEGLQPGTKVTIRTSMGQARATGVPNPEVPARKVYPPVMPPKTLEPPTCSTVHTVTPVAKPPLKLDKKKTVERMITLLIDMQEIRKLHGNQVCLECNFDITNINNISNHFPTYVHCSRCRYSTSCSRAYADHMISYHTQRGKSKYLMFGKMKKSGILLRCSSCTFTVDKGDGDEMAQHLDINPNHGPCCFVTVPVNHRTRGSEVAEEAAEDSDSWLPEAEDESDEGEATPGGDQKSSAEEKPEETPGPAICGVKIPVVKIQQIKTVRLSSVCSTDYINARVSSRVLDNSSPPSPTASSDNEGVLSPSPTSPTPAVAEEKIPSPEKAEDDGNIPSLEKPEDEGLIPSLEKAEDDGKIPSPEKAEEDGNIPSPEKAEEDGNIPSPEKAEEEEKIPSPEKPEEDGNIPSPEKAEEEEVIPIPEKAEDDGKIPSLEKAEEDGNISRPEKAEDEEKIPSPEKEEDEGKIPSPEKAEEDGNIPSPEKAEEEGMIPSPEKAEEEEKIPSPEKSEDDGNIPSPEKAEEEGKTPSPEKAEEARRSQSPANVEDRKKWSPLGIKEEKKRSPIVIEEERMKWSPIGVKEEKKPIPIAVEEKKPIAIAVEEKKKWSPMRVADRDKQSPIAIKEEKKKWSPMRVADRNKQSPIAVAEWRKWTPIGFVEEKKKKKWTPMRVEMKKKLGPIRVTGRKALRPVAEVAKESSPAQLQSKGDEDSVIQPEDVPSDGKLLTEHQFIVVLCALCCGVQAAADRHGHPRGRVEQWLGACTRHLDSAGTAEPPFLPAAAEERLVEWVLVQREQQLPITEETFLRQLAAVTPDPAGRSGDPCPWAVGFFRRHGLIAHAKVTVERRLPRGMEGSIQAFLEFAQRRANVRSFPRRMVANMDEIPIFLDPESLNRPDGALGGLGLSGTGQPQFVVVFTILADGCLLPTMVFSRGGLPAWLKVPRDILLEVKSGGHSPEDILRLWLAKVWRGHVAVEAAAQRCRSVLLLDSFRQHTSDGFIEDLSHCNSLPLVIPSGCSSRVQPLDMCISQTFKNFLQKRWGEYLAEAKCHRDVYGDVLQSLLNWVAEAAEFVGSNAELVQQSFLVASVLAAPCGRHASRQHKVAVQEELLSFLQEQLELGGKLGEADGPSPPPSIALDPHLLTRLFEADSDTESFYGFCEGDL
ncbi:pogo transposable element with ZNF domain isoform X3 [Leucoraja erinacea]|uniref:pogo transposable element with ZNF domain isoform X3 n=1 Tax=Leucoraja erinaceus TaxID=7782 RepID=UPI00245735D7|nr:pogo transposable element with ZNF domain isoform X3 [Leucoraja erinacea]